MQRFICAGAAILAFSLLTSANAFQANVNPDLARRKGAPIIKPNKPSAAPNVSSPETVDAIVPPPSDFNYAGGTGEGSRRWITPLMQTDNTALDQLQEHPREVREQISKASRHTIIIAINTDIRRTARVEIKCFAENGASKPDYSRAMEIAPGAMRRVIAGVGDFDALFDASLNDDPHWCVLNSSLRIIAYGDRWTGGNQAYAKTDFFRGE